MFEFTDKPTITYTPCYMQCGYVVEKLIREMNLFLFYFCGWEIKIIIFIYRIKLFNNMELRKFIQTTIREYLNENVNSYTKLIDLAKQYDYETFLRKSDSVTSIYNILYRGMYDQELTNNSFFTDYIGHAKQYGDYVDGIIYNNGDVLYFDDTTFNNLRNYFNNINKKELEQIYSYHFKNHKLFDVMDGEYSDEESVIKFVDSFIKSNIPYSKVSKNKVKNDLLIPIMTHYAKLKGKNIIQFVGGDYSDYGGADEFVVDDVSRYTKLSDIWKSVN